jgi:hypothetical protein
VSTALASDSIARERRNHTWDLLLLTAQPAQRIARGKIWASLWALRRDHMFVVILRLGLLGYGFGLVRELAAAFPGEIALNVGHLLLLTMATLLWSGADAIAGVALSVAAASLPGLRAVANMIALGVRSLLFLGGIAWIVVCIILASQEPFGTRYLIAVVAGALTLAALTVLSVAWAGIAVKIAGAARLSQVISQSARLISADSQQNIPNISQPNPTDAAAA